MKHFYNDELMAPNVLRVSVDPTMSCHLLEICRSDFDHRNFAVSSPSWQSDIIWVSSRSPDAFSVFQRVFGQLNIAAHVEPFVDFDEAIRLFSGFLVQRSICRRPNFHVDWVNANNEAFTFLTPLTDNSEGFGLLYQKSDGTIGVYEYKMGEALIFGDGFLHSTRPGQSDEPVVLLSFTFGTDKMQHWEKIAATAASQGALVCRPDGTFQGRVNPGLFGPRATSVLRYVLNWVRHLGS